MICAHCTEEVEGGGTCPACGESPWLQERYELVDVIGRGAMGTTYRARRLTDSAIVAVKELSVRRVDTVKTMELFEREASILEQLDHPGIPHYIEDFAAGGGRNLALFLVQEFIDGTTLEEEMETRRPTEDEVLEILAELLDVVDYLHRLEPPVIHRDIKPANVMRRSDGGLVLIDFGSVRAVLEDPAEGGSTVAGTFGFMAPEQFMGRAVPASDIYGLGATAVALLSRRSPRDLLGHDHRLHWRDAVDVDSDFEKLLDEMLRADPSLRPTEAGELARRARAILSGEALVPYDRSVSAVAANGGGSSIDIWNLPPAPRDLPTSVLEKSNAGSNFGLLFGGLFGGIGGGTGLVMAIAFFMAGMPIFAALLPLLFVVVFGGIGGVFFVSGLQRKRLERKLLRDGAVAVGRVTSVGTSNYSVNNQSATRLHYEFSDGADIHSGSIDTFDVNRHMALAGDGPTESPVLYDPDDPSQNMMLLQ